MHKTWPPKVSLASPPSKVRYFIKNVENTTAVFVGPDIILNEELINNLFLSVNFSISNSFNQIKQYNNYKIIILKF